MNAGELDRQITIQTRTETQDAAGSPTITWTTFASDVWAKRRFVRGREFFASQAVHAETTARFTIRYRAGVTPKMRIIDRSDTFDVDAALPIGKGRAWLELMCTQVVS